MAQTTTAVNACNVVLSIDNASGVPVDVSGSSNQAGINMTVTTAETNTFDGQWAIKKACKTAASLSVTATYSVTETEGYNILADWIFNSPTTSRSVTIDIPDSTVGSDRYTGEFVLESLDVPLSADDAGVILAAAALSNDGAFVRSTISS